MAYTKQNFENGRILYASQLHSMEDAILENERATVRNLLDNSDFRNPVNQRGEKTYKGKVYCIDRWHMSAVSWMASIEDGCIKVSDNDASSSTATTMFRQHIAVDPRMRGKTVTFVAKLKGNGMCRLNINNVTASIGHYTVYKDAAGTAYTDDEWHIRSWQGVIPEDADTFYVALQSRSYSDESNNKTIFPYYCEWVALYEGAYTDGNFYAMKDENGKDIFAQFGPNNLPEYRPKGYTAELMECRRYYVSFGSVAFRSTTSEGTNHNCTITYPVTMVADAPSVDYDLYEGTSEPNHSSYPDGVAFVNTSSKFTLKNVCASADYPIG